MSKPEIHTFGIAKYVYASAYDQLEAERKVAFTAHAEAMERAMADVLWVEADNAKLREDYNELLYHVAKKHPDETRHQTALRYIKQAETSDNSVASKSQKAQKAKEAE